MRRNNSQVTHFRQIVRRRRCDSDLHQTLQCYPSPIQRQGVGQEDQGSGEALQDFPGSRICSGDSYENVSLRYAAWMPYSLETDHDDILLGRNPLPVVSWNTGRTCLPSTSINPQQNCLFYLSSDWNPHVQMETVFAENISRLSLRGSYI